MKKVLKNKYIGLRITAKKFNDFTLLCKLLKIKKTDLLENFVDQQLAIYKY